MREKVNTLLVSLLLVLSALSFYYVAIFTNYYEVLMSKILWDDLRNMLLFLVFTSVVALVYSINQVKSIRGLFYGGVSILATLVSLTVSCCVFSLFNNFVPDMAILYFYGQVFCYFVLLGFSLSSNTLFRGLNEPKRKSEIVSGALFGRFIGMSVIVVALYFPVLITGTYNIYSFFLFLLSNLFIGYSFVTLINFLFAKISK